MAEAGQAFVRALNIDSTYAQAHYGLGNIRITQERLQEAEDAYRDALTHDSSFSDAHYGLSMAYFKRNAWNEAIGQLEALLQMDSTYTRAYFALGNAYEKQGNVLAALDVYRIFVERWDKEDRFASSARERIKALANP